MPPAGTSTTSIRVVLHQSNRMINETIRKKVSYPAEKAPSTLEQYGNTSSASVPLTLCATAGAWEFQPKRCCADSV
jgi:3-oxoacyl-[acyl-carrier-protein] synthase III